MKASLFALPVLAALAAAPATAQDAAEIGTLTCKVTDITNVVIYTEQNFSCDFKQLNGTTESYAGKIEKIGVDLSIKSDFTVVWAVLSPKIDLNEDRALAGNYIGAGADVAIGGGLGAKVLVGGLDNSFTLQPVSVAGVAGGGASVGIESFVLK